MRRELTSVRTIQRYGWALLGPITLAVTLSWMYFPDVPLLTTPGPHPLSKLMVVVGACAAVYFWYFFATQTIPWLYSEQRVRSAFARSDWEAVAKAIEAANRHGRGSDGWDATLGLAQSHLDRFDDALESFSRVKRSLEDPELEHARLFNHSYCLAQVGRIDDARLLFNSVRFEDWPAPMTLHVEEFRVYLAGEAGEPPVRH